MCLKLKIEILSCQSSLTFFDLLPHLNLTTWFPPQVSLSFVYVSFSVSGIPSGSSWSLIIDGRQFNSSSSILSAYVSNGTYYYVPGGTGNFSYSVILPQGYSLASEGSFNATSSAVISLVAQPTGGVTGVVTTIWEYLVVVAVAVGIVLIVGMLFLIKRRGK
jgi:hypothetical protein